MKHFLGSISKKHFIKFILALAVVVFASVKIAQAQTSELIHACIATSTSSNRAQNVNGQANTGSVRIVQSQNDCKPDEMYISWNMQGPPGPSGAPGAGGLKIYDSQNLEVGPYNGSSRVMFYVNGIYLAVNILPQGFRTTSGFNLYYNSSDCTGQPYFDVNDMLRPTEVVGNTAYYGGDPVAIFDTFSQRYFEPPSTYGPCEYQNSRSPGAGPLQTYQLPYFVPPFRLGQ